MASSADVINTTFNDLRGPMAKSFVRGNPLWDELYRKARVKIGGGRYMERPFAGGAPARGVGVYDGDELLNGTRRQQTRGLQVEHHRLVVAINIPEKDIMQNMGKAAVIDLIDAYPEVVMDGVFGDLNHYYLTGVSRGLVFATADLRGCATLNGDITTGRGVGVSDGILDFTTAALQNQTVQSVAKSAALFYFNHWLDIPGWNINGMFQLYRGYRQAAHYAKKGRGPDIIIMGDEVYANYEQNRRNAVRVEVVESKTEKTNMLSLDFGVGKVHHDLDLDRTEFAGDAADGVTYMLNSDDWELGFLQEPDIDEFKDRHGDQDVITAKFKMQGNPICKKLTTQCAITGGAV